MNTNKLKQSVALINEAFSKTETASPLPIYTIEQFSKRNPAFTEAALRNLTFKASARYSSLGEILGNGLIESGALLRLGRKVLIHEPRFFNWLDSQQNRVV